MIFTHFTRIGGTALAFEGLLTVAAARLWTGGLVVSSDKRGSFIVPLLCPWLSVTTCVLVGSGDIGVDSFVVRLYMFIERSRGAWNKWDLS
jgi:hypothetical protein